MRNSIAVAAVVASLATVGCDRSPSALAPDVSNAVAAVNANPKVTFFSFTKLPATPMTNQFITPAAGVNIFSFTMTTTETRSISLTRLSFMITGSLAAGDLTNFVLTYYPKGLGKPGAIVATNSGATWVPGPTPADFLNLDFTTPLLLDRKTSGDFVLTADVGGTRQYFFDGRLQTANINIGGVDQLLPSNTCDLPLSGDVFWVN